jgi:hypothetical protein
VHQIRIRQDEEMELERKDGDGTSKKYMEGNTYSEENIEIFRREHRKVMQS